MPTGDNGLPEKKGPLILPAEESEKVGAKLTMDQFDSDGTEYHVATLRWGGKNFGERQDERFELDLPVLYGEEGRARVREIAEEFALNNNLKIEEEV